ncbi:hypothetical protein [Roseibium polysiphoniae]|uniref:Uncharacterized protein n=1 Tax=Roseibium polysiphoniae TaxID=2571221 RepID=A0ABR9CBB5_9HYPH|nr:hypothetical protein [Roseibium polysiphoniae]MBD8876186.1 hypothetical protein [Roseibium polysiphoniae]
MLNLHDQHEILNAVFFACVSATRGGFPHLSVDAVIEPPHDWFDAALARQVVLHLMITEFNIPKRRVVEMQERSREAVNRALSTVNARLECAVFAAHYGQIAETADMLFKFQLEPDLTCPASLNLGAA